MASIALPLTQRPEWKALEDHYHKLQTVHLQTLFGEDPGRGERFAIEAARLYLDYSTDALIRRFHARRSGMHSWPGGTSR